ncbi:MAG: hypothetical protein K2I38_07480 [Duncaniella sp.]|nr:hypothetical protein [Duncaniella sp.]
MTHPNLRRLPRLRTLGLLLITLTALLASSCRSGRNAAGSSAGDYGQSSGKTLSQSELKTMLNGLSDSYGTWSDVKIPLTLRLKSPKRSASEAPSPCSAAAAPTSRSASSAWK